MDQFYQIYLTEIAECGKQLEVFAAQLPALWRRSKFRVKGLKKAERYNDSLCVVKSVEEGGRLGVQLINTERIEISIKRENIELVEALISESTEPEIHQALERIRMCRSQLPESKEGVTSATVNWARGLLDITYAVEIKIIDDEFKDQSGFSEVGILSGATKFICTHYFEPCL